VLTTLQPLVDNPTLDATDKLRQFFDRTQNWKLANKELLLELTRVMYRDENALLRTKAAAAAVPRVVPLLASILRQGVEEGAFSVEHPEESAEILLEMGQGLSGAVAHFLLNPRPDEAEFATWLAGIERRVSSYERGIERILGATPHSFCLITKDHLYDWFV
jgi:hypothetical protein